MKKSTKIIGLIALGAAVLYLINKYKKTATNTSNSINENGVPPTEPLIVTNPNATIFNRTKEEDKKEEIVWRDITTRRCVDPTTGQTIYVKGPCPTIAYAVNTNQLRK